MTAEEILIPKEKTITLNGKPTVLRPLSFSQIIKTVRFIFSFREDFTFSADDPQEFMLMLFEKAEDKLPELVAILTGLPAFDPTAEEAADIMLAVAELNNFSKIFANFQKAVAIFQKAMPKAPTQSVPPSQK